MPCNFLAGCCRYVDLRLAAEQMAPRHVPLRSYLRPKCYLYACVLPYLAVIAFASSVVVLGGISLWIGNEGNIYNFSPDLKNCTIKPAPVPSVTHPDSFATQACLPLSARLLLSPWCGTIGINTERRPIVSGYSHMQGEYSKRELVGTAWSDTWVVNTASWIGYVRFLSDRPSPATATKRKRTHGPVPTHCFVGTTSRWPPTSTPDTCLATAARPRPTRRTRMPALTTPTSRSGESLSNRRPDAESCMPEPRMLMARPRPACDRVDDGCFPHIPDRATLDCMQVLSGGVGSLLQAAAGALRQRGQTDPSCSGTPPRHHSDAVAVFLSSLRTDCTHIRIRR